MKDQYNRRSVAHSFGAALRAVREAQGVSQDTLSERCDFDRTYPSLLERGLRGPTVAMLLRISDALSIAPERLLGETVARLRGDKLEAGGGVSREPQQ
jgi:transcriptional regulator with XRE-family HTH domain